MQLLLIARQGTHARPLTPGQTSHVPGGHILVVVGMLPLNVKEGYPHLSAGYKRMLSWPCIGSCTTSSWVT